MRDGKTRRRPAAAGSPTLQEFLDRYDARVTLISGPEAGTAFPIVRERVILGRGPGVDRAFDDPAMSRQHAAIELAEGGLRIRDLGSTNGTLVNGAPVQSAQLRHGDRFEIGAHLFLLAIEEREREPETYELEV